ncbi:hypothetical protein PInf_012830 [Phytophthora infestans]|nr:hypothetical protein PInf_012830 [Phytophthora infestans]
MEETRTTQRPYGNTGMHRRFSFSREAVEAIEKRKHDSSPDKSPRKAFSSPSMTQTADDQQVSVSPSEDVTFTLEIKSQSDRFSDDDSDGSAYSSVCSKDEYSPTPSSAGSVTSSSPLLHREQPAGFKTLHSEASEPSPMDRQDKPQEGVESELQSKLSLDLTAKSPLSPTPSNKLLPAEEKTYIYEDDLPDWLLGRTTLSPPASTTKMPARSPQQIEGEIRFAVDSAAARVQQELGRREQFNSELRSAAMWSPTATSTDKPSATSKLFSSGGNDFERRANVSGEQFGVQEVQPIADLVVTDEAEQGDLLLLMEVVIGDGRTETIEIHDGDNPDALAAAFAQKYALQPDSIPKLRHLIQEQLSALDEAEPHEMLDSEQVVEDEWVVDTELEQFVNATYTSTAQEIRHANEDMNLAHLIQPEPHTSAPNQLYERENHREFNYNNLVARYGHYSQQSGKVDPEGSRERRATPIAPLNMQIMDPKRTGERVSASSRAPTFTTTVQGNRSSNSKKKTNLVDAPAYERLHALAESKDKWIQRAQRAKELEQMRDEQRLQTVELMAAKSRELVANRTNGNYSHIGERLHDEALSDISKKVQRHERRVVEREQQQSWMCPKCGYVNQYNDARCQNKMAQKTRAQRGKSSTPEVLCGQPKPERLFQPTLITNSSSTMKAVHANKEKSSRMASLRRQRHQSAIAGEFQQTCPFKPKINKVSKEIPNIGVNALWVSPDKSQSDFVERLAVDKYHELERKRVALYDKYAPDRDPNTGKELFQPETGRAPAFSRNKQGLPIGDFLHAVHSEQQAYHRQLREKDQLNGESSDAVIPARVDLSALPVEISRVVAIVFEYANHVPISRDAFSGYIDRLWSESSPISPLDPEREAALAEEKELTFHPVIDKNSREIATKHGRVAGSKVFEALNQYYDHYLERKEQFRKQQQREFKKTHPFQPTLVTKPHLREPAAAAFYDKILIGNYEDSGNVMSSWGVTASVSSAPVSNRNVGVNIPASAPLQTALSNARPSVRPIENEPGRFYPSSVADEAPLEDILESISRSSSCSQLEDAELTSRVLAALDEKPASTSPTPSYLPTKARSANDDSNLSADKECSVRSREDSVLSPANFV